MLNSTEPEELVRTYLLGPDSFVFGANPEVFIRLQTSISRALSVPPDSIVLVGSGKLGFSTTPGKFPAAFSERSDLDVAVLSEPHFDFFWSTIRLWAYPRRGEKIPREEANWLRDRKDNVFWGWLYPTKVRYEGLAFPDSLKPLRNESARWFRAFKKLSLDQDLAKWEVIPRLYRGQEQLVAYHADGLRRLRLEEARREASA